MTFTQRLEALKTKLKNSSDELVDLVTTDPTEVKPGKTTVWVQPPTIDSDQWNDYEVHWVVYVVSGTATTQAQALMKIMAVLDAWTSHEVNVSKAAPATFQLSKQGNLGCYEVTLNPI